MDRFGANRNMAFKSPQQAFVDPDGLKYYAVGYSASQSSYVSETEQVIHHKGAPAILHEYYDKLNPKKLGLLNGPGRREGLPFGPWSSTHDEKADKFSSIDQADHRFWNPGHDQSPPRAQVGHQSWSHDHHDLKKDDEYSPRARVGRQPWGVTHDHGSKKDDGFSHKARVEDGYNASKGSPRGAYEPIRGGPRARDHYDSPRRDYGKYNNFSDESEKDDHGHFSDDDDAVCEGGVCYRKGSESKLDNKHLIKQDYNQEERTKLGHSYRKDNRNDSQLYKEKDNNIPPYRVPLITTSPRDDRPRYEQSKDIHHPPPIKTRVGPSQGMDLRKDQSPRDSPRFGAPHQPQYGSPRKEYQGRMETIDSGEARGNYGRTSQGRMEMTHSGEARGNYGRSSQGRMEMTDSGEERGNYGRTSQGRVTHSGEARGNYGRTSQGHMETTDSGEARGNYRRTSPHGGVYVKQRYGRTIDCKTAAEKYNGLYIPN